MNRLIPAGALVLAAAIFFGYVQPTYTKDIAETQAMIKGESDALAAAAQFAAKQNQLVSAQNSIAPEQLGKLSVFLPDSVDNIAMIIDLNALAARSNIVLSGISVGKSSDSSVGGQGVGSIDLSLSATGTYQSFRTFLRGIERSARILDVSTLSVQGSDTGVYTYAITLRLYWLR